MGTYYAEVFFSAGGGKAKIPEIVEDEARISIQNTRIAKNGMHNGLYFLG